MRSSSPPSGNALASGLRRTALLAALLLVLPPQSMPVSAQESSAEAAMSQAQRLARLQAMTPEQRVQFGQRLAAWNALPRSEREERRARYRAWLQLEAAERAELRVLAARVGAFPAERRQALHAQFDALQDVQRQGWRLGPVLGRDYALLHPLLAYVPEQQRLPLLARLRGMDAEQRADLAVLAQRTPPQDRQALRGELLAIPSEEVAAWLRRKLDQ